MTTVEYLAGWFVRDMWEVRIDGFDPPAEFADACVDVLIAQGQLAPDEREWALEELAAYWPDYRPELPTDVAF